MPHRERIASLNGGFEQYRKARLEGRKSGRIRVGPEKCKGK